MSDDDRYRIDPPRGLTRVHRYEMEPAWLGVQTFLKLPLCFSADDLRQAKVDVAVGGAPWDGTQVTRSGTHLGPRAIRACDYHPSPPFERMHQHVHVDFLRHLTVCDFGDAEIVNGDTERTFANITRFVGEIVDGGAIPVIIGGDHGITWPDVTAVAERHGFGKVGVVHFDAHADTAPDWQGVLASHGAPMRRLIESGAVAGRNFVQVGLRGYWPGDDILDWMMEQGMRSHWMAEIQQRGFDAVLEQSIEQALDGPDALFLSVDIDVADPSAAPGTGAPEPGGLTARELLRAVRRIAAEVGIVGMDLVEVSPPYDAGNNITCLLAHRCICEALTGIAMRRLGMTDPDYLAPRFAGGDDQGEIS